MNIVLLCEHPEYIDQVACWTWNAFCKKDRPNVTLDTVRKKLQLQKQETFPHTYIALCDKELVGTVALYENDLKGETVTPWLGSLFVPETLRGKGIARALIGHIRTVARKAGFHALYLRTEHTGAYYEALGWNFVKDTIDPIYHLHTSVYQTKLSGYRVESVEKDQWNSVRLWDDAAGSSATIAVARGGILTQFYAANRETMHLQEDTLYDSTKNVRGGCPILFPICGRLVDGQYTYNNRIYSMNIHGIARNYPWKVVDSKTESAAEVTILLESNAETREVFPFDFQIYYTYRLCGDSLEITQKFVNCSREIMPFCSGIHPYFRIDPQKSQVQLHTQEYLSVEENMKQYDYQGTTEFADAVEIIAQNLSDFHAELDTGLGHRVILDTEGEEYRYYVIWSPENVPFACVEPWTALPNAFNTKKDLIELKPGEEKVLKATFTIQEF